MWPDQPLHVLTQWRDFSPQPGGGSFSLPPSQGTEEMEQLYVSTLQTLRAWKTSGCVYQIVDQVRCNTWMKGSHGAWQWPLGKLAQSQVLRWEPHHQGPGVLPDALLQVGRIVFPPGTFKWNKALGIGTRDIKYGLQSGNFSPSVPIFASIKE